MNLVYALDIFGTAAFAFSGVMRAASRKPDIVGMSVLATAAALGGGIVRDAILGRQAAMLADPAYLATILVIVAVAAMFPRLLRRGESIFAYGDAVGLGIVSAMSATLAVDVHLNPLSVLFIAGITGTGGGILRDVLMGKTPLVLYREIYISAVLAGAGGLMLVRHWGGSAQAGFLTAMGVTIVIRVMAIWRSWSLPRLNLRPIEPDNHS